MSELATPTAKRLERPSWKDHRLLLGIILVLLAGTLGARLVATAGDRTPYYVAAVDLLAGERVTADVFKRADVALGDGAGRYVSAGGPPPAGKVLLRDIRAGELVPASALGAPETVDVQRVTVRADAVSTAGLQRGHRVDVYVTPDTVHRVVGDEKPPQTSRLLSEVAVVDVLPVEGGFGAAAMTSVQLHVPADRVRTVVEAVDQGAKLTLVPVMGPLRGVGDA